MPWPSRHLSVSIRRPPQDVYRFAADPRNLPEWAAGLASGVRLEGGAWVVDAPMGPVVVRFVPPNEYGVLDHDVTLPSGEVVRNPMRVIPNDQGSEVVFTLYRRPEMSEEAFAADADAVARDLQTLRRILESG